MPRFSECPLDHSDVVWCECGWVRLPPNPKQIYGDKKPPLHLIPSSAIIEEAMALKEGANKYDPFNWRETAVEAQTYIGAALRHLYAYQEGENYDPDSGAHHLGHARACLAILIDAAQVGKLIDNRPPSGIGGRLIRENTVE